VSSSAYSDPVPINGTALADRVAGDGYEGECAHEVPAHIRVSGSYIGGDPTLHRIREVTVEVPITSCYPSDYTMIIRSVLTEMGRLAKLGSYETTIHAGKDSFPVEAATSGGAS
jgi:hypothetical protein